MLKIGIVTGSTRPNPKSLDVAKWVLAEVHVATVRAQVLLSMMTDFESFTTFKPQPHHEKSVGTVLDQVVAWGGALKQLR